MPRSGLLLRRRDGKTAIAAPGAVVAVGVAGSVIMAVLAVLMPMLQAGGLPTVYLVFPLWALIGAAAYGTMRKARANL